jgi:hypothetical protein
LGGEGWWWVDEKKGVAVDGVLLLSLLFSMAPIGVAVVNMYNSFFLITSVTATVLSYFKAKK